ncbi:MAG: TrmH family RNA methyltransferase [Bdellovibrionota bacterium]
MKSIKYIESVQNKKIKSVVQLRARKERNAKSLFTIEGAREIGRALQWDYRLDELYFCSDFLSADAKAIVSEFCEVSQGEVFEVSKACFEKIAVRDSSDGVLAVFQEKRYTLSDIKIDKNPLLLVIEGIEKPGNLGALLRSADGVGIDAVIVTGNSIDLYNPNVIRASVGSVFSVPVVECRDVQDVIDFIRENNISAFAAALKEESVSYLDVDYTGACAVFLGSEAFGLSDFLCTSADKLIVIPMAGTADSLNVSVAGAVILYEAIRQRKI